MVRVINNTKNKRLIQYAELSEGRKSTTDKLEQRQLMSSPWKHSMLDEKFSLNGHDLYSINDLSSEGVNLGYDLSVCMQEYDDEKTLEIITKINHLSTIWRSE